MSPEGTQGNRGKTTQQENPIENDPQTSEIDGLQAGAKEGATDAAQDPVYDRIQSRAQSRAKARLRLDLLLVQRGLVESREQAKRLIMAGQVLVDDAVSDKPGKEVPIGAELRVRNLQPYVSRGGQKLEAGLEHFDVPVVDAIALDVGASTGGFTDCLLHYGAARVYAVDVGYGQLAWKLRNDPRVVSLERTNIRYLEALPDGVQASLAVIDASFISLELVLPPTLNLLEPLAHIIALIKPQFEAGQGDVGKGGVVRDGRIHQRVISETIALAHKLGLSPTGLIVSPLLGPAGNVEFLIHLRRDPSCAPTSALDDAHITAALEAAHALQRKK